MDNFFVNTDHVELIEYNDLHLIMVLFLPLTQFDCYNLVNNLVKKNLRQLWNYNFSKDWHSLISKKKRPREYLTDIWNPLTIDQVDSGFRKTDF